MARRRPLARRLLALPLALALTAASAACSDDDADGAAPSSTSATTSTTVADGLVQVEVEGRPSGVLEFGGDLWVADDDTSAGALGGVRRLEPGSGRRIAVALVGQQPVALVPAGDAVWAIGATGIVTKLDAAATESSPGLGVELGGALVDGAIAGGRLFVADIERSLVHVLDPENGEVVDDPIVVEAGAVRLVTDGNRLWVSGLEDQVTPIDVEALVARQPVTVGQAPIGMAIAGDVLWVANSEDDTVSRISLESGQAIGEPLAVGDAPIAVIVDGADAWVLDQDGAALLHLDAETGEPLGAPIALPMRPRGMALSASGIWVVGVDPSLAVLVPKR
jgi:DNA-binding beta-propeller fold protein YncE